MLQPVGDFYPKDTNPLASGKPQQLNGSTWICASDIADPCKPIRPRKGVSIGHVPAIPSHPMPILPTSALSLPCSTLPCPVQPSPGQSPLLACTPHLPPFLHWRATVSPSAPAWDLHYCKALPNSQGLKKNRKRNHLPNHQKVLLTVLAPSMVLTSLRMQQARR